MKSFLMTLIRAINRRTRDEPGAGLLTRDKERRLGEMLSGR